MCDVCLDLRILTVFGDGVVFMLVFLRSMHAFLAQSVRDSDVFFLI